MTIHDLPLVHRSHLNPFTPLPPKHSQNFCKLLDNGKMYRDAQKESFLPDMPKILLTQ